MRRPWWPKRRRSRAPRRPRLRGRLHFARDPPSSASRPAPAAARTRAGPGVSAWIGRSAVSVAAASASAGGGGRYGVGSSAAAGGATRCGTGVARRHRAMLGGRRAASTAFRPVRRLRRPAASHGLGRRRRGAGGAAACGAGMLIMVAGSVSISPAARDTRSATTSGVATSPALAMASSSDDCASTAEANGPPRRSARVSQLTIAGWSGCVRPSAVDLLGVAQQRSRTAAGTAGRRSTCR